MTRKIVPLLLFCAMTAACGGGCPDDIHQACASAGCADKVKALAAKDASLLTKPNQQGLMPIHVAADAKTVEALVAAGADINVRAGLSQATALDLALEKDRGDVAAFLLSRGAEIKNLDSRLREAAAKGRARSVEALIDAGAPAGAADPSSGATPLHLAALNNQVEAAKVLIKKGADANAALVAGANTMSFGGAAANFKTETGSAGGATPLALAKSEEMKALLREAGAR